MSLPYRHDPYETPCYTASHLDPACMETIMQSLGLGVGEN